MWGTATSAYQIEGGYLDEGKGLSIWDAFCHTPGKISGNANADISTCHYYRWAFVVVGNLSLSCN
jgi:beta-glucosidase/6-phospho-beta-glucosidase/beta-galactosidase